MDEMDDRVRGALQRRADDIEATPELWAQVRRRRERRSRRLLGAVTLAGAACIALVAALTFGGVMGRIGPTPDVFLSPGPDASEEPSEPAPQSPPEPPGEPDPPAPEVEEPTGEPDPPEVDESDPTGDGGPADADGPPDDDDGSIDDPTAGSVAPEVVVGAGPTMALSVDGAVTRELFDLPELGHSTVAALAVRPPAAADQLTVAWLASAEGMWDLRWTVDDGAATTGHFLDADVDIDDRALDGAVPSPVWAPQGDHVAWVEGSSGTPLLRIVSWGDDGPIEEVATLPLDDLRAADRPRAQTWVPDLDGGWMIHIGHATAAAANDAVVPVTTDEDGALALGTPTLEPAVVARSATSLGATEHVVVITEDDSVALRWTAVAGDGERELPDDVVAAVAGDEGWIASTPDGVYAGAEGATWFVPHVGAPVRLPDGIVTAAATRS